MFNQINKKMEYICEYDNKKEKIDNKKMLDTLYNVHDVMQSLVFPTGEDFVGGALYDGFDRRCFNTEWHEKLVYDLRKSIEYINQINKINGNNNNRK
jgi:hypothetical protein